MRMEAKANVEFPVAERSKLPAQGPLLLVVGRIHGAFQGGSLLHALKAVRPDIKVFFGRLTGSAAVQAEEQLRSAGAVLVFSAADLSRAPASSTALEEAESLAALAMAGGAAVQALRMRGSQRQRWIRSAFGAALPGILPTLRMRAGAAMPVAKLLACESAREAGELLQVWQWLLAKRGKAQPPALQKGFKALKAQGKPLASALPAELLEKELASLPSAACLARSGDMECFVAGAEAIPGLLREIGRLREESFRAVGEGSGLPLDLDRFDQHYQHLFIWHRALRCVVGGYRFVPIDQALERFGPTGLYSHGLMRFKPGLLQQLDPAIELGRSFVALPFQRDYAPLLLLWKGIGAWIAAHPRYLRLFGLVSMSADYQPIARELVASFIKQSLYRGDLAALTRPRHPYGPAYRPSRFDPLTWRYGKDLDHVSGWVSELEPDSKGLPVLFRQYAKMGGFFFGFNVDPSFGDALDALVCVDLRQTDPRLLARTMGAEQARSFLAFHAAVPSSH